MFVFDILAILWAFLTLGLYHEAYKKAEEYEQKQKEKKKFLFPFKK